MEVQHKNNSDKDQRLRRRRIGETFLAVEEVSKESKNGRGHKLGKLGRRERAGQREKSSICMKVGTSKQAGETLWSQMSVEVEMS